MSSYSTSKNYQTFYLGNPSIPFRVLTINMNLITIFCFFQNGNIIVHLISVLYFFVSYYLDEYMSDNEEMNADMIDAMKKDLETMLPNFEEHLRKKYPMFVRSSDLLFD